MPNDPMLRVLLQTADVRVVHLRLSQQWQALLDQASIDYPDAVRDLLGQCCVATLLISAQIKFDGRLSLQLNAEAPLRTVFAECTRQGGFRGIARFSTPLPSVLDLREQGHSSLLAVTIEGIPGHLASGGRYQGLVPLDHARLDQALEAYFAQSEQLPTRILLAANASHAAGLLVQQLPSPERLADSDAWPRVQALFDTLSQDELLTSDGEALLYRLFHEESPQVLEQTAAHFACTCSRQRVIETLRNLGESEAMAAIAADDHVEVDCQFCGRQYRFDRVEVGQLFHPGNVEPSQAETPTTRH